MENWRVLAGRKSGVLSSKLKKERIEKYNLNPKLCLTCSTKIEYEKRRYKFCSRSCGATHNNIVRYNLSPKNLRYCKFCNKELLSFQKLCCSTSCVWKWKFETEKIPKIEAGKILGAKDLKRYLTKIFGYKCSICSNTGTHCNKKLVLQLDHIDGNSDNNFPENLRLLCPNCHSQTETFATRQKKDTKRNRYLRKLKGYSE